VVKAAEELAQKDLNRNVKAAAIALLVKQKDEKYASLFEASIKDSSYSVAGAALKGLVELNKDKAYELAKQYANDAKGDLGTEVFKVLSDKGSDADFDMLLGYYNEMGMSQEKFSTSENLSKFMTKMNDTAKIKKGIDAMVDFRNQIPGQFKEFVSGSLKRQLDKVAKAKGKEISDYIEQVWK
jgi:aminopeptidase N